MVRSLLGSDRGGQLALLPVDARDLLPADHLVWEVLAAVDELDLSPFRAVYRSDGWGRPPYDPAMMVALILYCYRRKALTSREIEEACVVDLGCRVITGNRRPDHATISRFLTGHDAALRGLLPQTLRLCDDAGLIDLGLIAADGTKFQANAAMDAAADQDTLHRRIADLRRQIADMEAQWQAGVTEPTGTPPLYDCDCGRDHDCDCDRGVGLLSPHVVAAYADARTRRKLAVLRRTLRAREQALAHLAARPTAERAEWEARLARDQERVTRCRERLEELRGKIQAAYERRVRAEAAGARIPGTRPVPADRHAHVRQAEAALTAAIARAERTAAEPPATGKVNTTDPYSRIMPTKHGGYDQLHNVQVAATAKQIIIGIGLHDNPNDKQALAPLLATTRATLDQAGITRRIGVALFDAGYASGENFTAEVPVDLLLVAVEREARQTGRLDDRQSTAAGVWEVMTTRLADPVNQARYRRRGAIIEPVFAQLFNHFGHDLHLRGAGAETELYIWAASHNLGKLLRHRRGKRVNGNKGTSGTSRSPG